MSVKNDPNAPKWTTVINTVSVSFIPIVLMIGGYMVQKSIQQQAIKRDYVQLAVSILQKSDTSDENEGLRGWAVKLLNDNSNVKLSESVQNQLKSGDINLGDDSDEEEETRTSLETLDSRVKNLGAQLVEKAAAEDIEVVVFKGLLARGATEPVTSHKPGKLVSYEQEGSHAKGLAFDVYLIKDGREVDDEDALYNRIGAIGKSLGLKWNGDLPGDQKNKAHFEMHF